MERRGQVTPESQQSLLVLVRGFGDPGVCPGAAPGMLLGSQPWPAPCQAQPLLPLTLWQCLSWHLTRLLRRAAFLGQEWSTPVCCPAPAAGSQPWLCLWSSISTPGMSWGAQMGAEGEDVCEFFKASPAGTKGVNENLTAPDRESCSNAEPHLKFPLG